MKNGIKTVFDYIGSRRFAVILLLVTTLIIFVSNLIPNPVLMTDTEAESFIRDRPLMYRISNIFHVMNITRSPFFLIIPAFIVASITICTYRRVGKRAAGRGREARFSGSGMLKAQDVRGFLDSKGWKVEEADGGGFFDATKGRGGIWGSVAFHAGMVIVILGGIVSMMTLFKGDVMLTEGFESYPGEQLKVMLDRKGIKGFPYKAMLLKSFDARYVEGGRFPLDYTAVIGALDQEGRVSDEVIKVNSPLNKEGYQFLLQNYYFSPRFVVTEKGTGRVINDAYINLLVVFADLKDDFYVPESGVKIIARFFPDFSLDGERPKTRSMNVRNPAFILEFFKGTEKLGDGILPLGKKMDFDEGRYTIEFRDLRKWIVLSVSRDYGLPIVKLGLLLVVLGLVARFILNEKRLWVKVTTMDGVRMAEWGGRAGYFPALFEEELKRIGEELTGERVET